MVVGRIYGIAAILLALDAMFSHILGQLLPVLVVALGVLILLTPMGGGPMGYQTTSQKIRRYVFGIFIGIIGLVPIIQNYTGSFYIPVVSGSIEILPWASVEVWTGQVILILILLRKILKLRKERNRLFFLLLNSLVIGKMNLVMMNL